MSFEIDTHRRYLRDAARVGAFDWAIREVVRPGDVVVDLASGTGILGMMACRAGARRVYAIEIGPLAQLAREIAASNGFADRITVIRGAATLVSTPEPADVIVCDQLGWFGIEAGLRALFVDARRRLLKPDARLIPTRVNLIMVPVEVPELFRRVQFWGGSPAGFNFAPASRIAGNSGYPVRLPADCLLGTPHVVHAIDLVTTDLDLIRIDTRLTCTRDGIVHGFGGWFDAQLSPSVHMSNSPWAADRINRRQVYLPIQEAVPVRAGDVVGLAMRLLPEEGQIMWEVTFSRAWADTRTFRHSTFQGMLIDPADLRMTDPDGRPSLTPRGAARLSVLTLCDGRRTLRDIEAGVYAQHQDLFRSPAEAAEFVAEVVTRYSADG